MPSRKSVIVSQQHTPDPGQAIEAIRALRVDDTVTLTAVLDNPVDRNAVACLSSAEVPVHMGFLPRTQNVEMSRLLTGGRVVRARVDEVAEMSLNVDTKRYRIITPPKIEIWW